MRRMRLGDLDACDNFISFFELKWNFDDGDDWDGVPFIRKGGEECMEEDAKQASIPYTYNAPQHDWKCGYPDNTRGKKD